VNTNEGEDTPGSVYEVDITGAALADAEEYVSFIRDSKREPDAADTWFRGLVKAIFLIQRDSTVVYQSHRIVFCVDGRRKRVTVLRVYDGSRRSLQPEDFG